MAPSNIFVVDDLRHFKDEVLKSLEPESYIRMCRTSQSAVETLNADRRHWDQFWFDHDLGTLNGEEDGEVDDTMAVVDYLIFRDRQGDPVSVGDFIIHSSNPAGVRNIAMALNSLGRASVIVNPSDFFFVPEAETSK